MNGRQDDELEFLGDAELLRLAHLLSARRAPEPPLDPAFRSQLRRDLLRRQWESLEVPRPWWRRMLSGPGLAWTGAAAGAVMVAAALLFALQPGPANQTRLVTSPLDNAHDVAVVQPMEFKFQQPMDHASVESALQIQPATSVSYVWQGNTLVVQPEAGELAPNTQYKVTLGPTAQTAAGETIGQAATFVFVTAAPLTSPTPPAATPTPTQPPVALGNPTQTASASPVQPVWSADGSTLYFAAADGSLASVPAAGGAATALGVPGVAQISLSPDGKRLGVLAQDGIYTLRTDGSELASHPLPNTLAVGWRGQDLLAATPAGVFKVGSGPLEQGKPLVALTGAAQAAFAPAGDRLLYLDGRGAVHLVDLGSGGDTAWTSSAAALPVWSADGSRVAFPTNDAVEVAAPDGTGAQQVVPLDAVGGTAPADLDLAWTGGDLLLGTPGGLYVALVKDGALTQVLPGAAATPAAPAAGTPVAWTRAGGLWTAALSRTQGHLLSDARAVLDAFMRARAQGDAGTAAKYLDPAGQKAYQQQPLVFQGQPHLTRWFLVFAQPRDDGSVTALVRLVLADQHVEREQADEMLTLKAGPGGGLLVDGLAATSPRPVDSGPEVLGVTVEQGQVQVTFDSDLDPMSVGAVTLTPLGGGSPVTGTYANRTLTFSLAGVPAGTVLQLTVPTSLRDVNSRAAAATLGLQVEAVGTATAPGPSPSPLPSPSPSPNP